MNNYYKQGNEEKPMAIRNSDQDWSIGKTVKVGFLSLKVTKLIPTPGDYKPDAYELVAASGARYEFVPHNGLHRI